MAGVVRIRRSSAFGKFSHSANCKGGFCALLPGAALNAPCPGYRFIAVCGPVAGQMRSIASGEFSHSANC
ncbi:hypothetical protein, partial [Klebsiella michiganensis]|uniref:hypothetical protein n=1 Tax=Klebsiella michiganensis TaxID=1134687 RepID=UPI0027D40146